MPWVSESGWKNPSSFQRDAGTGLQVDRSAVSNCQSLAGELAPPGNRHPSPIIAIGSEGCILESETKIRKEGVMSDVEAVTGKVDREFLC